MAGLQELAVDRNYLVLEKRVAESKKNLGPGGKIGAFGAGKDGGKFLASVSRGGAEKGVRRRRRFGTEDVELWVSSWKMVEATTFLNGLFTHPS
jgi:hypothetical protein